MCSYNLWPLSNISKTAQSGHFGWTLTFNRHLNRTGELYVYYTCSKPTTTAIIVYSMYHSKGGATDSWGTKISLYKDVRSIFTDLKELGIPMAAASRYV